MNILSLLTGGETIIDVVKHYIKKIFIHEARKYQCQPSDLKIVINCETTGEMSIMTYSIPDNKVWRVIPDKEVQEILIK